MAKPYPTVSYRSAPTLRLTLLIVMICLIMISTSPLSSSSARLILNMPLNLALPDQDINAPVNHPSEIKQVVDDEDQHHVLPCKSNLFGRKYGSSNMVLNMLPKGVPLPPSGPSQRSHNITN